MNSQVVILIHGLMRSAKCMRKLKNYLNRRGYEVIIYHYPSTLYKIHEHALAFKHYLEKLINSNPYKTFHFVTHSLGGIVAREALSSLEEIYLEKCTHLIMLAPPNRGSFMARISCKIFPFLASIVKPLAELSCAKEAYVHSVPTPPLSIGIIAGRFDAKTPPSTTLLDVQNDFLVVNAAHTFIMKHPKSLWAIDNFLRTGSFS